MLFYRIRRERSCLRAAGAFCPFCACRARRAAARRAGWSARALTRLDSARKALLHKAVLLTNSSIVNASRYRTRSLPAAGALLKEEDAEEKQIVMEL